MATYNYSVGNLTSTPKLGSFPNEILDSGWAFESLVGTDTTSDNLVSSDALDSNSTSTVPNPYPTILALDSSNNFIASLAADETNSASISSSLGGVDSSIAQISLNSGNINYTQNISPVGSDWFSTYMSDAGVINLARSYTADGQLSRNDMISIFRDVKDDGIVNAEELTDLRTLVNNGSYFGMPNYVQDLSDKLVNGNVANAMYQGSDLGNLYVGSSDFHMESLIGEWFLGSDLPATTDGRGYNPAGGRLFGNDETFSFTDIRQGALGDCYFIASLGATAHHNPSAIQNMFIDNYDGTYTVQFYGEQDGTVTTGPEYLTVNTDLPSGYAFYDNADVGLWVALAEKAFTQFAEQGLVQHPASNSYSSIESGWGFQTMPTITGRNAGYYSDVNNFNGKLQGFLSLSEIDTVLSYSDDWSLTADTYDGNNTAGIIGNHEYVILGANTAVGTIDLYNPWGNQDPSGSGFRTISYDDFAANFHTINIG